MEALEYPYCSVPRYSGRGNVLLLSIKVLGIPGCLGHQGPSPGGLGSQLR